MTIYPSVEDLIGDTPLLEISELSPNPLVRIFAKLEGQNPGGSVKDRIALAMLEAAEADGALRPGQTILEPSSGNTGIALAMLATRRGHRVKIVLPDNVSDERRQLLEIFGAEIIASPGSEGSNGAVRLANSLSKKNPHWAFLYQYANEANPRAHYQSTGPEIWKDLPDLTHFVAGFGTSGTLMGVGTFLKEQNDAIEIWAVEPPVGESVAGLRNVGDGFVPPIFEQWEGGNVLDRKMIVRPKESIEAARRLVEQCGVFAGISGGAALAGAVKVASRIESGVIAIVIADGGWKYLSTRAWTDPIDDVVERSADKVLF